MVGVLNYAELEAITNQKPIRGLNYLLGFHRFTTRVFTLNARDNIK